MRIAPHQTTNTKTTSYFFTASRAAALHGTAARQPHQGDVLHRAPVDARKAREWQIVNHLVA
jgi:hypothetical protein